MTTAEGTASANICWNHIAVNKMIIIYKMMMGNQNNEMNNQMNATTQIMTSYEIMNQMLPQMNP